MRIVLGTEELADVLSRPQSLRRLAAIQKGAKGVLDDYASIVEFVEPAAISPTSVDPDDDAILGCALAAGGGFGAIWQVSSSASRPPAAECQPGDLKACLHPAPPARQVARPAYLRALRRRSKWRPRCQRRTTGLEAVPIRLSEIDLASLGLADIYEDTGLAA